MANNYYINGRVAVLSTKLLTKDRLLRMAESDNITEALKSLYEVGFGGGRTVENVNDYEQLLQYELYSVCHELNELSNNQYASLYFLLRYDYHNAKLLTKCKYMRVDYHGKCFDCGTIDSDKMQQWIYNDNYNELPQAMRVALSEIDMAFANNNRSPLLIDVTLDKAMYSDINRCATLSKSKLLREYYTVEVDTLNLLTMFRVKKAGQSVEQYKALIVDGGSFGKEWLIECFDLDSDKLLDRMYGQKLLPLVKVLIESKATGSLAGVENYIAVLKRKIMSQTTTFDGIEPLLQYYLNKLTEIDAVRYILIAKKSSIEQDIIKQHIKELYE